MANNILKRYPAGSITPHGSYYLAQGDVPTMKLRSYDDTLVFTLLGGENISNFHASPGNVYVKDMKGLIPPWKQIDQKGATQDGRTFVTSLYDPCEVEITGVIKGKTPKDVQQTRQDLVASIDAIQASELSWFTHKLGRWWSDVRWMAAPVDVEGGIQTLRQLISLRLRAYDSFWRSYDVVDQFRLGHTAMPGDFSVDAAALDPTAWQVTTTLPGAATGGLTVAGGQVVPTLLNGGSAIARRVGFSATTPVVELQLGSFPQWYFDSTTAFDFWVMAPTNPVGEGYRLRVGKRTVQLHSVTGGVATLLSTQNLVCPPKSGEAWTFVAGPVIQLLRSGAPAFQFNVPGYNAAVNTSAGFGAYASGTVPPPNILSISFGDDATTNSESGFLRFVNWGDQPMPQRFLCVGPGDFYLGDGPNATNFVKFGTLLPGQAAQILTDERKRGVTDLSFPSSTTNAQDTAIFSQGVQDWLSFFNLVGGLMNQWFAWAGVPSSPPPAQGNLYSLMDGRFSSATYIPAKPVGGPPVGYHVPVRIENGNVNSQIIGAATPLRRLPY